MSQAGSRHHRHRPLPDDLRRAIGRNHGSSALPQTNKKNYADDAQDNGHHNPGRGLCGGTALAAVRDHDVGPLCVGKQQSGRPSVACRISRPRIPQVVGHLRDGNRRDAANRHGLWAGTTVSTALIWHLERRPRARPKLRVVWMPRPPLACAFAPRLAGVSDYLRRVSGMAAPMSSKAWRCSLVGSARTGTVAGCRRSAARCGSGCPGGRAGRGSCGRGGRPGRAGVRPWPGRMPSAVRGRRGCGCAGVLRRCRSAAPRPGAGARPGRRRACRSARGP